jgi:hypothetical protein
MVHDTLFPNSGSLTHLTKVYELLAQGPKIEVVRFQSLKVCVTKTPLFYSCLHLSESFILELDVSKFTLGALCLSQTRK